MSMSVAMTRAPSRAKASAVAAADARRRRRQQRNLTRQSSRHVGRSFRSCSAAVPRRTRAGLLGDIAARS